MEDIRTEIEGLDFLAENLFSFGMIAGGVLLTEPFRIKRI